MRGLLALAVLLAACGGEEDFTECSIGQLTGTWRLHYREVNGNCGAIADETIMMSAAEPTGTLTGAQISPDRCRMDIAFTAPTTDGQGTQTWTMVFHQTGPGQLEGTGTVQLNHYMGTCRSTYDLTMSRL